MLLVSFINAFIIGCGIRNELFIALISLKKSFFRVCIYFKMRCVEQIHVDLKLVDEKETI